MKVNKVKYKCKIKELKTNRQKNWTQIGEQTVSKAVIEKVDKMKMKIQISNEK